MPRCVLSSRRRAGSPRGSQRDDESWSGVVLADPRVPEPAAAGDSVGISRCEGQVTLATHGRRRRGSCPGFARVVARRVEWPGQYRPFMAALGGGLARAFALAEECCEGRRVVPDCQDPGTSGTAATASSSDGLYCSTHLMMTPTFWENVKFHGKPISSASTTRTQAQRRRIRCQVGGWYGSSALSSASPRSRRLVSRSLTSAGVSRSSWVVLVISWRYSADS